MRNTALSAMEVLEFADKEHEAFFFENLDKCRCQDVYHMALIYCLGISETTRKNINSIYDFKTGSIKTECLRQGWQTSGSIRVVRLAFNLYCNGTPSVNDMEDTEAKIDECKEYSVEQIFCCDHAKYFWEAVKLRYPEYCL